MRELHSNTIRPFIITAINEHMWQIDNEVTRVRIAGDAWHWMRAAYDRGDLTIVPAIDVVRREVDIIMSLSRSSK